MIQKKIGFLLILIILLGLTGCLENDITEEVTAKGLEIMTKGNVVTVSLEKDRIASEIKIINDQIRAEDIIFSERVYGIVKNEVDGLLVTIVSKSGTLSSHEYILDFEFQEDVNIIESNFVDFEEELNITGNMSEVLLGDFNNNGTIDLKDLSVFKNYYYSKLGDLEYNEKYDIYPSKKGEGLWKDIYSLKKSDGKIDINDFVILVKNLNKEIPLLIEEIKIEGLSKLVVGDSIEINASVKYSDGSINNNIELELNNEELASLNGTTLIGLKAGILTLIANVDGEIANKVITIVDVESIDVLGENEVKEGKNISLIAEVTYTDDSKGSDVEWTVDDEEIAIINNNGILTGITAGTVKVKAEKLDKSKIFTVEVLKNITVLQVKEVKITTESNDIIEGDTLDLNAIVTYENNSEDSEDIVWTSQNKDYATITNGVLTAIKAGKVKIIASKFGKEDSITININEKEVVVSKVTISGLSEVQIGESIYLSVVVTYSNNTTRMDKVTWTVDNEIIAKMDNNNMLNGLKLGTVIVTAEKDGIKGTKTIEVKDIVNIILLSVSIVGDKSEVKEGEKIEFNAIALYSDETVPNDTVDLMNWTSSDESIAIVNDYGTVTGVSKGTVIITVQLEDKTDTKLITVSENIVEVESVKITGASDVVEGSKITLKGIVTYINEVTDSKGIIWTSSNEEIATVSNGIVTALSKGTVEITATKKDKTDIKTITVSEKVEKGIVIYIEEGGESSSLYAWVGDAPSETKLLGEFPGKTSETLEAGFYVYDFGIEYKVINYIHFLKGQSADATTDKSIWITKDGVINIANPYKPSKPMIIVSPVKEIMHPEQNIKIEISAVNNTVDNIDATFNGKSLSLVKGMNEVKVGDYLSDGESGSLLISADNSIGSASQSLNITADASAVYGLKLFLEKNGTVYAWTSKANLNGGWPGTTLTDTVETFGNTWYVFDFEDNEGAQYIINGSGGESGTQITGNTWITASGGISKKDPFEPTAPIISISPSSGIINNSKGNRTITIMITADNATVDSKKATIGVTSVSLTGEKTVFDLSDYLSNKESKTIKVTASNDIGSSEKEITIKRDDEYVRPTGEFTWDNGLVYFVLTDRFYNGNEDNDFSYGRKNDLGSGPLDIATFHGGDLAGLTQKIEEGYFTELGVNAIWFTAAYEQIHGWVGGGSGDFAHYAYHGYYGLDWTMLDRNMGTVNEMRTFVDTAHENNIRVVMDVVVNHAGYNTVMDMYDFGFASFDKGVMDNRDWMHPMVPENWQSHHETLVYYKDEQRSAGIDPTPIGDWLNWWGPDWVRTGIDGYDAGDGSELENPLSGLPDFKTELKTPVEIAPILQSKWGFEKSDGDDDYDTYTGGNYDDYIIPAAKSIRNITGKTTPADYVIDSLAAWVEEFGIDGFRCDTAKHIEIKRWGELQEKSNIALNKWRSKHSSDDASDWDEDFWMVGEHWDFKNGADMGYSTNGFETMIDFGFPLKNGGSGADMLGTWQGYADTTDFVAMPYLNSHDMGKVGFFAKGSSTIPAGTALVLNPSPVQIFYGDENDRSKGPSSTDPDHGVRSDYEWGANPEKLEHWNKLGRFRNLNPAVGAGDQKAIAQANAIKRTWNDNVVVIIVDASGSTEIDLSDVSEWPEGTKLRNAYNGEEDTITDDKVTFTGENGLILIEDATKVKR